MQEIKVKKRHKEIARSNGISVTTLYRRLAKGWDIEKATQIPTEDKIKKKQRSSLFGQKKGKLRSFRLPEEYDETFQDLVDTLGMTAIDLAGEIITKHLQTNKDEIEKILEGSDEN